VTAVGVSPTRSRELLARYVSECPFFWEENTDKRQCEKLANQLAAIERSFGLSGDAALDRIVEFAEARVVARPATVYISGRGGSGSHWVAEMLGDLRVFANAGEVSVPARLVRAIAAWPLAEQGMFVDCIHLLHGWAGQPYTNLPADPHPDIAQLHLVNSNGDSDLLRAKQWDPDCVFIHLIRDPREQVMSFTYRKPTARAKWAVVEDVEDFFRLMLIVNRASASHVVMAPVAPDLVLRYEDLRRGSAPDLRRIVDRVGVEIPEGMIDDVAYRHSAEARRRGEFSLGNLSKAPSKTWRESTSERERRMMHAGLAEVVDTLGYEPDDCQGKPLEFVPLAAKCEVALPDGVVLGELHIRADAESGWERAGHAAGRFTLPAGVMVRLRAPAGWTVGLSALVSLLPENCLSSLCVAGNVDFDDTDVRALRAWPGLLGLDLGRTSVTDASIDVLIELQGLRQLSLVGTSVSSAAVDRLRKALPACEIAADELISDAIRGRGLFNEDLVL
jgi:hypothetical protein